VGCGSCPAGIPGLHVLTGVNTARDVVLAQPEERPAYLHTDLRGLLEPHPEPVHERHGGESLWTVGEAHCGIRGDSVILNDEDALTGQEAEITLDAYRALACAVWEHLDTYGAASAPKIPDLRVRN